MIRREEIVRSICQETGLNRSRSSPYFSKRELFHILGYIRILKKQGEDDADHTGLSEAKGV